MVKGWFLVSSLCLLALAATGIAKADTMFYLTESGQGWAAPTSTLCGGTNCFGVVDLSQSGSNVNVAVTLTSGVYFVATGNSNSHETFAFNLPSSITTADIVTPSGWAAGSSGTEAGYGTFSLYEECGTNCTPPGTSTLGSLAFTVDGVTISQFGTDNGGTGANYFAADVIDDLIGGNPTGNIADSGPHSPPPVPEPSSLMLLGMGLTALAGALKLRHLA